jgi:ubiquinone biosynthesis protein COQ9
MITPPERSAARDAAIDAVLPIAATMGWTREALRQGAGPDADILFPGGGADMVEAYIDLADRRMEEAGRLMPEPRLSKRVRALLEARFLQAAPHRDAVRRAASLLAQPGHALLAARCTARTVDAIWHAAGDTSADFSWYTKRAILAAVYSTTLLYWMAPGATHEGTMEFLDRRLAGVARIGKLRARFTRPKAAPTAA